MGLSTVFADAVTNGITTATGLLGDMTALFGVFVGIGIAGAAFAIVAGFVKR